MAEQDALSAAHEAVRRAQRLEGEGHDDEVESHWREAERHYEAAGVDADWFDTGALMDALDEPAKPMNRYSVIDLGVYEFTYGGVDEPVTGLTATVDSVVTVEE